MASSSLEDVLEQHTLCAVFQEEELRLVLLALLLLEMEVDQSHLPLAVVISEVSQPPSLLMVTPTEEETLKFFTL